MTTLTDHRHDRDDTALDDTALDDTALDDTALDDTALELREALGRSPRTLPPRWLYDERGSELFSQITGVEEYYQTETERQILATNSAAIAEITEATTVIELGSGTSDKTRTLLDAFVAHGLIEHFVPLDVSEMTLLEAADMLSERHPTIDIDPVVGDFTRHLARLSTVQSSGPKLVLFLGGTIGNFYEEERAQFLAELADVLAPGDWLLIGIDQVKPIERLIAAYDDAAGVTEAFIRNALTNINTTYGGDIDVEAFEYVPFWDGRRERVDMRLRAQEPVSARLDDLDVGLDLVAGEEIRVEISAKFRPETVLAELAAAGFDGGAGQDPDRANASLVFADDDNDFALVLACRR
jgi:L-histidine Nalpha-methyltransferase